MNIELKQWKERIDNMLDLQQCLHLEEMRATFDRRDLIELRLIINSLEEHIDSRADVIDECKQLIKARIIDNLGLENATKYGNKDAVQQANSYSTIMKYEIADCIKDLFDDLEQVKENG